MAASDDPRRESAAARERLNALATELAGRTTPGYLKRAAKERVSDATDNLKGKVMDQTQKVKDNARSNPIIWGAALGGAMGLLAGLVSRKMLSSDESLHNLQERRAFSNEYGFPTTGLPDEGDHFSVSGRRGFNTGGSPGPDFKSTLESASKRSRQAMETTADHPLLLALIGIGLGIVAARVVPESDAERQKVGELKQRASERIARMGEEIESRIQGNSADKDDTDAAYEEDLETTEATFHAARETSPDLH